MPMQKLNRLGLVLLFIFVLSTDCFPYEPQAKQIKTDTANFNNNLSSADNTVQKALDTLDEVAGGGGAPADADYLVGTANAGLSGEIVVGTTPGGELGGTWASPTVDDDITLTNITQITNRSHTSLTDIGTNAHSAIDTFIASKATASGLASLDISSKVIQDPANATATPTASKIPIADASAKLDGWITLGNEVALGSETSGSYAAGDAEAGNALTGDTATAFFAAGAIERARGGTAADTSAYGAGIIGSDATNATIDIDTIAEIETALGGTNVIINTEIDTSSELAEILTNETGSGAAVFGTTPRFTTSIGIGVAATANDVISAVSGGNTKGVLLSDNATDSTDKEFRLKMLHWDIDEEAVTLIGGLTQETATTVRWGGGYGVNNAVTQQNFYTAANNATLTGTVRLSIDSAGEVLVDSGNLQVGKAGVDGHIDIYSEQGATDYTFILAPNDAMAADWTMKMPANIASAESFLKMGTDGVIDYDTNAYTNLGQSIQDAEVDNDITLTNITQITNRSHTSLTDIGTNAHSAIDTFIASKAAASGLASLDVSSKVVQDPANATATPTASKIPIADTSAKLDGWITLGVAVDISSETNLSGDTENVLTGDALSIASGITRDTEWDTWVEHPALTDTHILVGNVTNDAVDVAMSGDVSITNLGATAVADDSHAHTTTTLSGIDISADTNLTAGDDITLTDDDLDVDSTITRDTEWNTIDFLVGTATASLSGEIAVGTAPGGELGGTWASPTLDDSITVTGWELTAATASTSITSPIHSSNNADPADAGIVRLGNAENIAWEASPAAADETLTVSSLENFQISGPIEIDASDPADAEAIRLDNAEGIAWEASPTGTDVTLKVDANEILQASGAFTSGGDITSTGDVIISGDDLTIGATGVKITDDADGQITLLGLSAGADENMTINLDDTTDEVVLSSGTSAQYRISNGTDSAFFDFANAGGERMTLTDGTNFISLSADLGLIVNSGTRAFTAAADTDAGLSFVAAGVRGYYFYDLVGAAAHILNISNGDYAFHVGGVKIGVDGDNGWIDDATHGAASTVMYIGNQTITTSSDVRLKKDIEDTKINALDTLDKLRVVDFNWNDPTDNGPNNRNMRGRWTGTIAQETVKVVPYIINAPRKADGVIDYESKDTWLVQYDQLVPVLIKAIQEQQKEIEELRKEIKDVKESIVCPNSDISLIVN